MIAEQPVHYRHKNGAVETIIETLAAAVRSSAPFSEMKYSTTPVSAAEAALSQCLLPLTK